MKRKAYDLSLILIDIDYFKSINDQFGHDIGDEVLKVLSSLVQKRMRKLDYFFRLGGEEFAILALNTNLADAKLIAEDIRSIIASYPFPTVGPITISLGLSQYLPFETSHEFFKRGDKALYKAKNSGRNCYKSIP